MDSILRDLNRESSKIHADVDKLYRHYENLTGYVRQHLEQSVREWARLVVSHPGAVLLIVETSRMVDETGYAWEECEPIRFTLLHLEEGAVQDWLLYPTHSKGVAGTEYHGLTMADVEGRPRLAAAWPDIEHTLQGRHIVIFGLDWAQHALKSVSYAYSEALDGAYCLHNKCKEYYGEFYDLSLQKILGYQGIDRKREQLTDSRERIQMLAQVLQNLAAGVEKQAQQEDAGELDDLDEHPF